MLNLTGNISIEEAARMIYPQNPGLAYEIETADEQIEQLTRRAEETEEQIGELEQTLNDVQTKLGIYIVYSLLIYKAYFLHKIILDSLAQIAHYSLAR